MIKTYARLGQGKEALQLFHQMHQQGVLADNSTFVYILSVCASLAALVEGKKIHACVLDTRVKLDVAVGNSLLNMYGKCGCVQDAVNIFEHIPHRDLVSWTAMIAVYANHGLTKAALQLFEQMQGGGVWPNRVTFISILSACASQPAVAEGKRVHARIEQGGVISDTVLETALINMYAKCGKLKNAQDVFDRMTKRDIVSWNAIVTAYAQHQQSMMAFKHFEDMQREGLMPDKVTFISIVDACANCRVLAEGERFHTCILKRGFELDVVVGTSLVNMYGKCSSLEDAHRVFDKMPKRTLISWNVLINVYSQHRKAKEALQLFDLMQQDSVRPDQITFVSVLDACAGQAALAEGKYLHASMVDMGVEPDLVVGNALVNMYGKCGSLDSACSVFEKMSQRDVVSWTALIAAYVQQGHSKDALFLFTKLQGEGIVPDKVAFVSGLAACMSEVMLVEGKQMHEYIIDNRIPIDIEVGNALVSMYARCGSMEKSLEVFNKMLERNQVSWNAIIGALSQHGLGKEAISFYADMQKSGVAPNNVTFTSVLAACSHAGLVDEGCRCFVSMSRDHGISPDVDHHDSIIALLVRSGCLDEAEGLVTSMPFQPTVLSFLALLGACRHLADVERGERIAKYIFELDPQNSAVYVFLSNLYAAAGWDVDATGMICRMRNMDSIKCSVDLDDVMDISGVDGSFCPEKEVYAEVQSE